LCACVGRSLGTHTSREHVIFEFFAVIFLKFIFRLAFFYFLAITCLIGMLVYALQPQFLLTENLECTTFHPNRIFFRRHNELQVLPNFGTVVARRASNVSENVTDEGDKVSALVRVWGNTMAFTNNEVS